MKLKTFSIIMPALLFSIASHAEPEHTPKAEVHWGYSGHESPEFWGDLSADFSTCKTGKQQSPINITHALESNLPPLTWNYQTGGDEVVNNGHAIQVNYQEGSSVTIDDKEYAVKQFHFHHPSENTIDGRSFPLEAHIVHQSADGKLAVVAIMFEYGEENSAIKSIWEQLPDTVGATHPLKQSVSLNQLMPDEENRDYYRFNGSLTTPPCSEGVTWIVMKKYQTITKEEVAQFEKALKHTNNRPVQATNSREVLQ